MDEFVRLANGDTYGVSTCGSVDDMLFIHVIDTSIVEMANVMSNAENTNTIQHCYKDRDAEFYKGFTVLINLLVLDEHTLKVMLQKPEQ